MDAAYRTLLLCSHTGEFQLPCQQSKNPFPGLNAGLARSVSKIAFSFDRHPNSPAHKFFIEIREPNFSAPMRHGSIVAAEITFSQPANV